MKEEIKKMIQYHADFRESVKKEGPEVIKEMGGEEFFNHIDFIIAHLTLAYIEMDILSDFLIRRFDDDSQRYN